MYIHTYLALSNFKCLCIFIHHGCGGTGSPSEGDPTMVGSKLNGSLG